MNPKIQEYLDSPDVRKLAAKTRELYRFALIHADNFMGEGISVEWLSINMAGFASWLETSNIAGSTIQQYITCTKIFLKWAGHPSNYTYRVSNAERKRLKKKHLDRWFTEDEIEKCLAYPFDGVNGDSLMYRVIVRLLVETGARIGEIAGIRKQDISLKNRTIFIQGKTEPRPVFFSEETKTLLCQLFHAMQGDWLAYKVLARGAYSYGEPEEEGETQNREDLGPTFPGKTQIFPEVEKIKTAITQMLRDLGLKNGADGRGAHTFRHYAATYLFYVGNMRIEDLAYLLGDKVDTIREKYLHPTPAMLRARVDKAMGWD